MTLMETNTAMNRNDAAGDPLAVARSVLLEPHGLDVKDLHGAIGRIFEHKVDYADLYFQYTRSEGWSLDEGIVKSGSFAIEQGVGVRAVSGDRSAFAYSDEINAQALMSAADATRTIARSGRSGRTRVGDAQAAPARRRGGGEGPRPAPLRAVAVRAARGWVMRRLHRRGGVGAGRHCACCTGWMIRLLRWRRPARWGCCSGSRLMRVARIRG